MPIPANLASHIAHDLDRGRLVARVGLAPVQPDRIANFQLMIARERRHSLRAAAAKHAGAARRQVEFPFQLPIAVQRVALIDEGAPAALSEVAPDLRAVAINST